MILYSDCDAEEGGILRKQKDGFRKKIAWRCAPLCHINNLLFVLYNPDPDEPCWVRPLTHCTV
ncbi:MAG: hypothetical protein HYX39_11685 [Bacteroidetes bacterium]|nr:hypothetical protein [Bacteroidota bacterium]